MGMLWAQQIRRGKKTLEQVPRLLRESVRELLRNASEDLMME